MDQSVIIVGAVVVQEVYGHMSYVLRDDQRPPIRVVDMFHLGDETPLLPVMSDQGRLGDEEGCRPGPKVGEGGGEAEVRLFS